MTQILDYLDKHKIVVELFHILKTLKERLNMLSRDL